MSAAARLAVLLALVLPLAIAPEAGSVPGAPIPHCSPGPDSCAGWFTGNVTVSWTFDPAGVTQTSGCNVRTIASDGISTQSCEVSYGDSSFARSVTVRRDATPPQVTGTTFERGADADGWYNRPVVVSLAGVDATSGLASCDRPTYSGPDGSSVQVSGSCRDVAGNASAPATVGLKYDASPPVVSATADRRPDAKTWYRRPVTVRFAASDAVSGVASCSPATRYAGPDRAGASVGGTCRDVAGNVAPEHRFALDYDDTAPRLGRVRAWFGKRVARLGWPRPAAGVLVRIDRIPGVNGAKRTRVYRGTGDTFRDRTVRSGIRYRYVVTAVDAAGNVADATVGTGTQPALFAPAAGAVVRAPVRLAWSPASGARYYNLQLHRNGVKILSVWPRRAKFRVGRSWRYLGRRHSLVAGTYTWYVWPGLGAPERPRYGRLLGSSRFRVGR